MKHILSAIFCLVLAFSLAGKEYFVDYQKGKQGNPGTEEKPFADFNRMASLLKPGDTVHILPSSKPIRNGLQIGALKGTAEKPIVIDGMNNIFDGSIPLNMKEWKEVKQGVFCRKRKSSSNMMSRYYMIRKGSAVRMGRATKGIKNPAFLKPDELKPGEWTIVDTEPQNKQPHVYECYVRLAEGEKVPADGAWEEPSRISGVAVQAFCNAKECGHAKCGDECGHVHCEHVQIRNVIVRHFWNDGFNIHGKVRDILFEKIAAVECGDDGLSAHESTQITARNYVSIGCSTGICHIQKADCTHENVYIEGSRGVDIFPCSQTKNVFSGVCVLGDSPRGVVLAAGQGGSVLMKQCIFLNRNPKAAFRYENASSVKARFEDVQIHGYGKSISDAGLEQKTEIPEGVVRQKKGELFKCFGGKLEKSLSGM